MSSSTTRSPGQAGRLAGGEAGGGAEHLVEEQEAAVAVGEREAERQAVQQGVDMGGLVAAARSRHVVEQKEGGERIRTFAGRDLDDPQGRRALALGGEVELAVLGRGEMLDEGRSLHLAGIAIHAGGAGDEGAVGGEDRAGLVDDRGHQPGLAHPASRLAADQPAGLGGEILAVAALQAPQQMSTADLGNVAADRNIGERERRHDGAAVARGGPGHGGDRCPVPFAGELGRGGGADEPAGPGGIGGDQRPLPVGDRQRGRRRAPCRAPPAAASYRALRDAR